MAHFNRPFALHCCSWKHFVLQCIAQLRELLSPVFVWPNRPLDAPTFLWVLQAAIHVLHCSVHFFAVTHIELDSSHSVTLHVVQILGATISLVLKGKKELVWIWPKNLCVRSNVYQLPNQARKCTGQPEWSGQSCSAKGHRQGCSCRTPFLEQLHLTISPSDHLAIELAATNCCSNQESRRSWICPARLLLPQYQLWDQAMIHYHRCCGHFSQCTGHNKQCGGGNGIKHTQY